MPRIPSLFGALLVVAAGCEPSADIGGPCHPFDTGDYKTVENICRQQLYFPTGLAIDPDGDFLYVTNGNADLRYSGGSVSAIDLHRVECTIEYARSGFTARPPECEEAATSVPRGCGIPTEDCSRVDYPPLSTAQVGATRCAFDGCRQSQFDPNVVECDECPFIVDAVRIGNFAGTLRLQRQGQTARRLWMPVRGDPSVTWVGVDKDPDKGLKLVCDDPSTRAKGIAPACSSQRITVRDFDRSRYPKLAACAEDTDCPTGTGSTCVNGKCTDVALASEPFGMALDTGTLPDKTPYSRLVVTHLASGELSLINAGAANPSSTDAMHPGERVVLDVRGGFFPGDGNRGAFSVAPRTPGEPHGLWYATSKASPVIGMFYIGETDGGRILPTFGFSLAGGPFSLGEDVRELIFEPGGNRAFGLEQHPPSLFTVDTRVDPMGFPSGVPRNQVIDAVTLCQGPSHLKLRQWTEPGGPGDPERTVTRLYAVCFTTGQLAVIDPDLGQVLDLIAVGRGANDVVFNFGLDVDYPKLTPRAPLHRRAYVSNYIDMTISVIDLDRYSSTANRVIGRIGLSDVQQVQQ